MANQDDRWYNGITHHHHGSQCSCTYDKTPFSAFIYTKRNMFRDCVEEDASYTVLIDTNYDVSMREGDSVNKRLEDDICN